MTVELIYDADCPNVGAARSVLVRAFARTGAAARWREWERSAPDAPDYARACGSPTILVDGKDVAGVAPNEGSAACRVYSGEGGRLARVPPLDSVCAALATVAGKPEHAVRRWPAAFASLPAIGVAFLPKLTCPLCFPAYAALLSALGLEFFDYTPYLLPLTGVFLVAAMVVLALQTRRTGKWLPLILGGAASGVVLLARFGLESDWLTTGGVVGLVVAIFLGSRAKSGTATPCPACAPDGKDHYAKTQHEGGTS